MGWPAPRAWAPRGRRGEPGNVVHGVPSTGSRGDAAWRVRTRGTCARSNRMTSPRTSRPTWRRDRSMARGATIGHHCRGVARPPGLGAARASGRAGRRRARGSRDGVAGRRGVASPDKGDVCTVEPDDVTSHEPSDVAARPLYGPGGKQPSRCARPIQGRRHLQYPHI